MGGTISVKWLGLGMMQVIDRWIAGALILSYAVSCSVRGEGDKNWGTEVDYNWRVSLLTLLCC